MSNFARRLLESTIFSSDYVTLYGGDIEEDLIIATLMYKISETSTSSYLVPIWYRACLILSNSVLK
jgi:hypothetical protein